MKPNPAVSVEILSQISQLAKSGLALSDIIQRIRLQMVPPGYVPQTWAGEENCYMLSSFEY